MHEIKKSVLSGQPTTLHIFMIIVKVMNIVLDNGAACLFIFLTESFKLAQCAYTSLLCAFSVKIDWPYISVQFSSPIISFNDGVWLDDSGIKTLFVS